MANIYLVPDDDATYVSHVSNSAPSADAIFLTKEGQYPTVALYQRHDLNMCSYLMQEEIKNRADLTEYLDFLGKCRHTIIKLWDFDCETTNNDKLFNMFESCYERKAELMYESMMEACEGIDDDVDVEGFNIINEPDENMPF